MCLALTVASVLMLAGSAGAATLGVIGVGRYRENDVVLYRAGLHEVNRLTVSGYVDPDLYTPGTLFFRGSPRPRLLGRGCILGPGPARVRCPSSRWPGRYALSNIAIDLGDRNDVARIHSADPVLLDGGSGNDVLTGGTGLTWFIGGLGNDRIVGHGPHDLVLYSGRRTSVHVDLRRPGPDGVRGERDFLYGIEDVQTGLGPDVVIGNAAPNTLTTGPGNDTINVVGGGNDTVFCGPGIDTVRADSSDTLVSCEHVTRIG